MAYAPIAYISPQYDSEEYANWWLKAYVANTTTPKLMALEKTASNTVAKLQLNSDGFLITIGNEIVIPYIEGDYDLWLFPTESEADDNDTSNAIQLADDIRSDSSTEGGIVYVETVNDLLNFDDITEGLVVRCGERDDALFKAIPFAGTDNGYNILPTAGGAFSFVLELGNNVFDVKKYGAKGDSTTDDTAAIQTCINNITQGGTLYFPAGKYKLTDEIAVPAVGGITVKGDGGVDFTAGSPPPSGSGSFLFQTTNNKAIFTVPPGASYTTFEDISLSPLLVPTSTADLNGKIGVKIVGATPNVIWSLQFNRVFFYNLEFGVQCIDTAALTAPNNYSVAPVSFNQCTFNYPLNGVYLDSTNADYWVFHECFFFVPTGGNGAFLKRFGIVHFTDCSSGAASVSSNTFVNVEGAEIVGGNAGVEKLLFTNCQTETLTQFLNIQANTLSFSLPFVIEARNCIMELGCDIFLGSDCHFISRNNRYSNASIFINDVAARLSSYEDDFEGTSDISFLAGAPATSFVNLVHGVSPSPTYKNQSYLDAVLLKDRATTSVPNATATTIYVIPAEAAFYDIYVYIANGASIYDSVATVVHNGTNATIKNIDNGTGMSITLSGLAIQANQNSGTTQDVEIAVFRKR